MRLHPPDALVISSQIIFYINDLGRNIVSKCHKEALDYYYTRADYEVDLILVSEDYNREKGRKITQSEGKNIYTSEKMIITLYPNL